MNKPGKLFLLSENELLVLINNPRFRNIINDRVNGSTELLKQFLELIIEEVPSDDEIIAASSKFMSKFTDMIVIKNTLEGLINQEYILAEVKKELDKIENSHIIIANKIRTIISNESTIATFSNSKTVQDVINYLKPKITYVFESLPGGEGKFLSENILSKSKLVTDEIGLQMLIGKKVDLVLIGCDAIFWEKGIINKIGSRKIIENANQCDIKVYILSSSNKISTNFIKPKSDILEYIEFIPNMYLVMDN